MFYRGKKWSQTALPMDPSSCFLCTSLRYSSSSWSVSWLKGFGGSGSAGILGGLTGDWGQNQIFKNPSSSKRGIKWLQNRLQFTGGLSPDKTLARTWDWGPAVFMSWRFCCRIWGAMQNTSRWLLAKQDILYEANNSKNLVPCLNHFLRVREKRHKLVWIFYLDGCAACLCQLFCFQPL